MSDADVKTFLQSIARRDIDNVRRSLETGFDVNSHTTDAVQFSRLCFIYEDVAPLMIAARAGDIDIFNLLLTYGAKVDCKDSAGCTPLVWAVRENHSAILELLVFRGADITACHLNRVTALHTAAKHDCAECVAVLCAFGANVDAKTLIGTTPLHEAAILKRYAVARELLDLGADATLTDLLGWRVSDSDDPVIQDMVREHLAKSVKRVGVISQPILICRC